MAVAINVARTRVTALGFTLALYLFSIAILVDLAQEREVPALWVFLTSFVPLAVGFAMALAALLMFVVSERLDLTGHSEIWTFSIGELLTYMALAQALTGGFQYLFTSVSVPLILEPALSGSDVATATEVRLLSRSMGFLLLMIGGGVWFLLMYAAPVVFLIRNPLPWVRKWLLAVAYALILLTVFVPSAFAYQIHSRAAGASTTVGGFLVRQVWQPSLWGPPDPAILAGWEWNAPGVDEEATPPTESPR
jgi:hypothetical protein